MPSTNAIKPLTGVFWFASVACGILLLQGYYCKIDQLTSLTPAVIRNSPSRTYPTPQVSKSLPYNNNSGVTADMLERIHALYFYPSNSNTSIIAQLNTEVPVDDSNVDSLKAVHGQVYNATWFAEKSGYKLINSASMDSFRRKSPIHNPKGCDFKAPNAWLGEFRNVFVDGTGDVFIPQRDSPASSRTVDVVHYSFQGGRCCKWDWRITNRERPTVRVERGCHHKLAFAFVQHHGSTYSHLMFETIPRFFSFWKVVRGVLRQGGVIAVARHPLFPEIMQKYFGILPEQIVQIRDMKPCFFEKVIMPEAYEQGTYPKACVSAATENVLKALFLKSPPRIPALPVILLMERAKNRYSDGTCAGIRCLANFHALKKAVIAEFGNRALVETIDSRPKGGIIHTAEMFSRATVVVGVHGAGFANMMYMRQGTHVVHLGWRGKWDFYGKKAHARGINYVHVFSQGASQAGENVKAEIPVILLEIRKALTTEGYKLNPPIMKTDPRRNRQVVWRYP